MTSTTHISTTAIRPASQDDTAAVARLAALDSAAVPTGRLLLGIVDGEPLAALSLEDGAVVADPFTRTVGLVALLRQRAALLEEAGPRPVRARRALLARAA